MITVNPYLTFNGNCEEAFNHYKKVFGGEFETIQRFSDAPGDKPSPADANRILHVALPLSQGYTLMGSDRTSSMPDGSAGENITLSINTSTKKDTDQLFNGLAEGGKITMPIADAFWGSYFGMVNDKYGVQWMVSYSESR